MAQRTDSTDSLTRNQPIAINRITTRRSKIAGFLLHARNALSGSRGALLPGATRQVGGDDGRRERRAAERPKRTVAQRRGHIDATRGNGNIGSAIGMEIDLVRGIDRGHRHRPPGSSRICRQRGRPAIPRRRDHNNPVRRCRANDPVDQFVPRAGNADVDDGGVARGEDAYTTVCQFMAYEKGLLYST